MSMWNKRSGIMLAYPFNERRIKKNFCPPYLVQPKLNGERCRAIIKDYKVTLLSSEENVIVSVPHIQKAIESLGIKELEFDGELYRHGWSLQKIRSAVGRTKSLHPDYEEITYNIFDLIFADTQYTRLGLMYANFSKIAEPLRLIDTHQVRDVEEVESILITYMEEGYEGVIIRDPRAPYVRRRATTMLKWKPRKQDCYEIVEALEEIDRYGTPKDTLGALVLMSDGGLFNCGAGMLTHEERKGWWEERERLPGMYVVIKYPELTDRGVPSHPVLVEISSTFIEDVD